MSFHKQKMQKQGCVLLHFRWRGRSADLPSLTATPISRPGHHSAPMDLLHLIGTSRGHNLDLAIVGITFCAPTSLSPQFFLFPPQCSCSAPSQKPLSLGSFFPPITPPLPSLPSRAVLHLWLAPLPSRSTALHL